MVGRAGKKAERGWGRGPVHGALRQEPPHTLGGAFEAY